MLSMHADQSNQLALQEHRQCLDAPAWLHAPPSSATTRARHRDNAGQL